MKRPSKHERAWEQHKSEIDKLYAESESIEKTTRLPEDLKKLQLRAIEERIMSREKAFDKKYRG